MNGLTIFVLKVIAEVDCGIGKWEKIGERGIIQLGFS